MAQIDQQFANRISALTSRGWLAVCAQHRFPQSGTAHLAATGGVITGAAHAAAVFLLAAREIVSLDYLSLTSD